MGPQAHHRPVELQQGFLLPQGLLPVVRHRQRRARRRRRRRRSCPTTCRRCRSRRCRGPRWASTYDIIITGVGGTGVVTVGALLGMAAHLEGKGVGVLDMAGLAQKGGAVQSHVRIAERPEDIHAIRVAARGADLVLGGDIVVAGTKKVLAAMTPGKTRGGGQRRRSAARRLHPQRRLFAADRAAQARDRGRGRRRQLLFLRRRARRQCGRRPVDRRQHGDARLRLSGRRAAALGGVDRARDRAQRRGGGDEHARRSAGAAASPPIRRRSTRSTSPAPGDATDARRLSQNFDETVARRVAFLTDYQDAAYAARYRERVEQARAAEAAKAPGKCGLAEAVARNLFKLMAYKDEYEVARLYSDGAFLRQAAAEFDGKLRFTFHLAPPLLARRDPATGEPRKMTFGPWMMTRVRPAGEAEVPARHRVRSVRPQRGAPHRAPARSPTTRRCSTRCSAKLTPENHHLAVGIAAIPEKIRGFGHVKARHLAAAKADEAALLDQFRSGAPHLLKAAEDQGGLLAAAPAVGPFYDDSDLAVLPANQHGRFAGNVGALRSWRFRIGEKRVGQQAAIEPNIQFHRVTVVVVRKQSRRNAGGM